MKNKIGLFIVFFATIIVISSCGNCDYTIDSKSYSNGIMNGKLPQGICCYGYHTHALFEANNYWIEDSCNKYQIGDAVPHKK